MDDLITQPGNSKLCQHGGHVAGLLWLKANTARWFDLGSERKEGPPYKRGHYWMSNPGQGDGRDP